MNQIELKIIAKECAEKIMHSTKGINNFDLPFKHIVIDDFFPKEFADTKNF